MRLPASITSIAPVGAVLSAQEAGQALLSREAERHCQRLLVETTDAQGLSRWEADYGLADWSGTAAAARRGRLRGAMAGGQTLTLERLRALAASVSGADGVQVREDFGAFCVEVTVTGRDGLPSGAALAALNQVLSRQKPAHLRIDLSGSAALEGRHQAVLWGQMFCVFTAEVEE